MWGRRPCPHTLPRDLASQPALPGSWTRARWLSFCFSKQTVALMSQCGWRRACPHEVPSCLEGSEGSSLSPGAPPHPLLPRTVSPFPTNTYLLCHSTAFSFHSPAAPTLGLATPLDKFLSSLHLPDGRTGHLHLTHLLSQRGCWRWGLTQCQLLFSLPFLPTP